MEDTMYEMRFMSFFSDKLCSAHFNSKIKKLLKCSAHFNSKIKKGAGFLWRHFKAKYGTNIAGIKLQTSNLIPAIFNTNCRCMNTSAIGKFGMVFSLED